VVVADEFPVYGGNCPKSVSKDAKYVIRSRGGNSVVTLTFVTEDDERWLATTGEHPDLVDMVNAVKTAMGTAPNGPFYLNEFGQVIVPVGAAATYYLAGEYDLPLRFLFEGHVLSGEGVDLEGKPLEPGSVWVGPHPGVPYVLMAGKSDVYYDAALRPDVTRRMRLSKAEGVGSDAAAEFAKRIERVKGWVGGRFYVNEWREIFAPINKATGLEYRYIGHLELDDPWFPKQTRAQGAVGHEGQ
jgi:hypothetical protein